MPELKKMKATIADERKKAGLPPANRRCCNTAIPGIHSAKCKNRTKHAK